MINEDKKSRGQEGKQISSLHTLAPCGRGQGEGLYGLPRPHFVRPRNDETTCHAERRIDLCVSCHAELVSASHGNKIPEPLQEDPFCTKSADFGKRRQVRDDIRNRHCEAGFSGGRRVSVANPARKVAFGRYSDATPNNPIEHSEDVAIQRETAPTSILPHKGGSTTPSLEGRLGWVPINNVNSLTSCLPDIWTSKKKVAFTLAEVLITLGIIGVVAAMTLPTLIQKHQERVTVNKVKKFYSVMSQAQLLAIKDHGYLDEWDVPDGKTKESAEKLASYLTPYLKIAKNCGTNSGCLQNGTVKLLNGSNWTEYDNNSAYYKLILNDGTYMWFRSQKGTYCKASDGGISDTCGAIWIDVNGKNPPNTIGKDIFILFITKNTILASRDDDCNLSYFGWACASWILEKGNMDYLKNKNN